VLYDCSVGSGFSWELDTDMIRLVDLLYYSVLH